MTIRFSTERSVARLSVSEISPNPAQPRRSFPDESIDSLAESISEHGLLSPILVRRINAGRYELIAGERRLRALKKLGRPYADALIVSAYDSESAVMALIENIQREQLHYLDEAAACRAILERTGMTQEHLAKTLGRSPSALANRLRLMKLAAPVRDFLINSSLTERHARALLNIESAEKQLEAAKFTEKAALTVRQLENRIANMRKESVRLPRCAVRDHRLYINALMNTVDKLRTMGVPAETSVSETADSTVISITLKK